MRLASIIRFFIIGVLLISVIGMDGCSCNPPIIEWIKVFVDNDNNGTFEDNEEIQPDPGTSAYTINGNNAFQIRIKTREALSDTDLKKSGIQIQNHPEYGLLNFQNLENPYYRNFEPGTLSPGTYTANIIIYSNGVPSIQSITLQIKNTG